MSLVTPGVGSPSAAPTRPPLNLIVPDHIMATAATTNPMAAVENKVPAPPDSAVGEDPTQIFDLMKSWVELYMSGDRFDASHDFAHVERVIANARHILSVEKTRPGAPEYDVHVVDLAALLHDVDDHKYRDYDSSRNNKVLSKANSFNYYYNYYNRIRRNGGGKNDAIDEEDEDNDEAIASSPDEPTPAVESVVGDTIKVALLNAGASERLAHAVQMVCANVSFTVECRRPDMVARTMLQFPELAIVQDADRLDALGAVGVARTFAYTGAMSARGLQNKRSLTQTIGHFHEKLERLEGLMKTVEGKRIAGVRSERLREFRRWFETESGDVL